MILRRVLRGLFVNARFFKNIIDRYNAGGSENEDYYEQLFQFIEELKKENERADIESLTEEEFEILIF